MTQANFATSTELDDRSRYLRRLIVRGLVGGERGHVGSSLSLIEILRVLYDDILRHRPEEPDWPERDRCILSKGHGCLALYAMLADKGYFPTSRISRRFCRATAFSAAIRNTARCRASKPRPARSDMDLSIGVGMALAARMRSSATTASS